MFKNHCNIKRNKGEHLNLKKEVKNYDASNLSQARLEIQLSRKVFSIVFQFFP